MSTDDPATVAADERTLLETFLAEHRQLLHDCLDGLTEDEARAALVPSRTTLLGLVKHATFVEQVWFDEALTRRSRTEIGCPAGPEESFELTGTDTVASVQETFRRVCAESVARTDPLGLADEVRGNRRGPLRLRWVLLHVLREHAQHGGHADILREQVLARREHSPGGT